jgi:hypothetical protein
MDNEVEEAFFVNDMSAESLSDGHSELAVRYMVARTNGERPERGAH